MKPMRVLDLYCKAGGASMGYHMAGFEVYGIDIEPQINYPFRFKQADVFTISPKWIRKNFVAVVGSPPCLGYTNLAYRYQHIKHRKLIPATRDLMEASKLPYIIENVENARSAMLDPIRLCGSSFGIRVRRHRLFETGGGFKIDNSPSCNHQWQARHTPYEIYMTHDRGGSRWSGAIPVHGIGLQLRERTDWYRASVAMGIDWMTRLELNQAIPPVYTYWLGRRLKAYLKSKADK
jgi:DNA (cytosine-5)-methyltransferase 1